MSVENNATPFQRSLPTLDKLLTTLPDNVDVKSIGANWFSQFTHAVEQNDTSAIVNIFLDDALWRDLLALTWEFRTFEGSQPITRFLNDRLPLAGFSKLELKEDSLSLQQPASDLAWVQALFSFETKVGIGSGLFRIVPTASGEWKGYTILTNLEELKDFPERVGPNRDPVPNHGMWPEKRRREMNFEDGDPAVVIIGGGQSGLDIAARLKLLDVPTLVIEKNARIGDQWRGRYEMLCLHDPVWCDHLPYISYPPSWPIWTPAPKLADWLESYAHSMELNVWTSSTVQTLKQELPGNGWTVAVKRADGSLRMVKARHVVFAHGIGGGLPKMPAYPGQDVFEGKIIHSSQHKSAREHKGKKVIVIGACNSAHDIAHDHATHDIDVTMYQRSSTHIMSSKFGIPAIMKPLYWEGGPPSELADLIFFSIPYKLLYQLHQRVTSYIAEQDKDVLDGLKKRGFRLNFGPGGSGLYRLFLERGGGYYIDVGASKLIADGKIKLKNDSKLSHFTKNSVVFENGSELPADVLIFATGYGDMKQLIAQLAGDEVAARVGTIWGLNEEEELNTVWRWSGVPGLYVAMGNLTVCRFHSKHLALQIKAQEEGLYGERYDL